MSVQMPNREQLRAVAQRCGLSLDDNSLDSFRGLEMITNTAPFDLTHHPAMSIPCGMIDGLPAGLMLIGGHFDEPMIYRAAEAFEQSADWKSL